MSPLPLNRPKQLSLGPLESEILAILWELGSGTAREIHDRILSDPDRELAYPSVMTVLQRLQKKGWLICDRSQRVYRWQPTLSAEDATLWQAHHQLHTFLAVGNPDVVAAFADSLDIASVEQLEAIAQKIKAVRQARGQDHAQ
jgi:predicted transcriptional regulator